MFCWFLVVFLVLVTFQRCTIFFLDLGRQLKVSRIEGFAKRCKLKKYRV